MEPDTKPTAADDRRPVDRADATPPSDPGAADWHAVDGSAVLERLEANPAGLTGNDVRARLERYGPNELPAPDPEPAYLRFARQFNDVLIYILIAAAIVTALLGEWIDTGVILAVVLVNAIIGYVQEGKAEEALASLRDMLRLETVTLRDGHRVTVQASELVPGDIVLLESGDRVPADLRVLEARNVRIEEAALTGEAEPVDKRPETAEADAPLGDRHGMAYSGTTVRSGRLKGVVVATGAQTEVGRIGTMVSEVETLTTPLLRAIRHFGHRLSIAILGLGALVFAFGFFFRDYSLHDLFLITVSLAVAAIPEGLPAIMTITLALGVQRMARRNAILRRLPAVETLGSVTVICSDKTGTLTRNEMTVQEIALAGRSVAVTGLGYEPAGEFRADADAVQPADDPDLLELARCGFLCSDAEVRRDETGWALEGEPTEGAVVTLGLKAGLDERERRRYPRLDTIPFESERRFMATLHETPERDRVIYLKGAPERVLELSDRQRSDGRDVPLDRDAWRRRSDELAAQGFRVLAFARRDTTTTELTDDDADGVTLLGLVGIIDPPREEAIVAVRECQQAGIRVKMITGDHALTARAIGAQLGIGDGTRAVTGREVETMSDEELERVVQENDVFARSSPEHKLRLVQALQARGEVVAMTGDGVNDAPALKRADVGVAMGVKGSEAAKDASEMVLADDNFVSIERAVEEGRTIYDNLKKTILFILPTNGAEALIVLATVVFAFAVLPITPVQILWVNMVTAVTLALALAFDPSEPGIMRRPPRDPREPILTGYLLWRVGFVSVIIAILALWLFFRELELSGSEAMARTVAVNVLVAGQVFYLFNSRYLTRSSVSLQGFFGNRVALIAVGALLVFQAAFVYAPPLQVWFDTEPLRLEKWLWIVAAGAVVFVLVEIEKAVLRAFRGR